MKKVINSIILLAVTLLAPQITRAQGTFYLSNLGQSSTGSLAVGSNSWLATAFRTGNNAGGYVLDSIQIGMTDALGNPSDFAVMLYTFDTAAPIPGNSLGILNGSLNPVTGGIYAYTPTSNLTLLPNTYYYIVLTAGTAVASGSYNWSYVGANSYNPSAGWVGFGGVLPSSNGLSWPGGGYSVDPQYAITASAIPEPGVSSLLALGGLGFLWQRRKARAIS